MKTQNANIIWHLVWFRNATAVLGFPLLLSLSFSHIYQYVYIFKWRISLPWRKCGL